MAIKIVIADIRVGWTDEPDAGLQRRPTLVRMAKSADNFFSIGPGITVGAVFDQVLKRVGSDTIELLSIYAHGYANPNAKNQLVGGFGIEIGQDDITVNNAKALFDRFRGKFRGSVVGIELVGCQIAATSTVKVRNVVLVGDGVALCVIIAKAADTCVRASPDNQRFTTELFSKVAPDNSTMGRSYQQGTSIDPGPWEGNQWVICKDGKR